MKTILIITLGLIALFFLTIATGKFVNAQKYKVRSEIGVQKSDYVVLGGIKQYIQIRGQDISNPILVMLHGGPGLNMAYYSYEWQRALEQRYTIVHWDQRGCGNTYYCNKGAEKPTLDLLLSDLNELVEYICLKYGVEKVIVMGHSWGTVLGGIYSAQHPEKVSAYISIGPMLNFKESEQASAQEANRLANAAGHSQDAQTIMEKLASISAFQKFDKREASKLMKFRQLKEKYLPRQYSNRMIFLRLFSPYMTFHDLKWMLSLNKLMESNSELYKALFSSGERSVFYDNLKYQVPVLCISGDCDWTTPYPMSLSYFNKITAPNKMFLTIENTGHIPFVDKPKEFIEALLRATTHML